MIRKDKYTIEAVLSKITFGERLKSKPWRRSNERIYVDFDGDMINMNSQRYHNFRLNGTKCIKCGIEGKYFIKEKHQEKDPYHFNLYAVNKNGKEILMTKDHILSIAQDGKDHLSNYQTMCKNCNIRKGDGIKYPGANIEYEYSPEIVNEIFNDNPRKIRNVKVAEGYNLKKSINKFKSHWTIEDGKGNVLNKNKEWEEEKIKKAKREKDRDYLDRIKFKFKAGLQIIRELI